MYFFTSDLHLNSKQTLITDNRPFKTVEKFNENLIKIWNKQVTKKDTIYIVGDFFDCHDEKNNDWEKCFNFLKKIKAKIILILGNNEMRIVKYFFNDNFESFKDYCIKKGFFDVKLNDSIQICGQVFFITHKPKDCSNYCLNLFGHSHRAMGVYKSFGFNIACDLNHFKLYSEKDIEFLIYMKNTYWDKDENLKLN